MPWFAGDFRADTADLGLLEQAAYRNLIDHVWCHGGEVDNDQNRLLSASGLAADWTISGPKKKQILTKILSFFEQIPPKNDSKIGSISHKRVSELLIKAKKISELRAEAGRKGGLKAKKQKHLIQSNSNSVDKSTGKNPPAKGLNFWDVAVSHGIARSLVGKWIKLHGESRVAEALAAMAIKHPADPTQYTAALLQDRPKKLYVPKDDDSLVPFAEKNGFPPPGSIESYYEYRQRLWGLVRQRSEAKRTQGAGY